MNSLLTSAQLHFPGRRPFSTHVHRLQCGSHVSFRTMNGRCFLFDANSQNLYRINRIAAFVWCSLADGKRVDDVVRDLSLNADGNVLAAEICVHDALCEWLVRGLLTIPRPSALSKGPKRTCCVLGQNFEVRFSDGILELLGGLLLEAHSIRSSRHIKATLFVRRRTDGSISIETANESLQVLSDARSLAPAVFASLMRLALMHSPSFPALHAASVRRADGIVLFPAPSGSGKSTLMAGLLAADYEVLGDDTVVFERASLEVSPLTPYVCVKSGSWNVIADRIPGFTSLPSFVRADDARVRYLLAENGTANQRRPAPVRAIVFPNYRSGTKTRLVRLNGATALQKLLPDLDPIGRRLEPDDIDRLIEWVSDIDCFTLPYGSLDDAIAVLSDILR